MNLSKNPEERKPEDELKQIPGSNYSLQVSDSGGDVNKHAIKQRILPSLKEFTNASSLQERTEKQNS